MKLTAEQLIKIMPFGIKRIPLFLDPLDTAIEEFEIDTIQRIQMFVAQIAHESGEFRYTQELATGEAYENRKDLGNTVAGYGKKYKGRGLIQLTGYFNYKKLQGALQIPCVDHPELLETPANACRSAAWFWKMHSCNELADNEDFLGVTKKINGGVNGLASRVVYFNRAKMVIV
jgi:putative chitinase